MVGKRSYAEGCPIAHALDLVGERWALLVIRELRLGPRRHADLQAALPGLGPSVLSQRLRDLEQVGVLQRRTLPPPAASKVYELTEWGAELEPVFRALARWGVRSPVVPLEGDISADSMMLGLRTFFPEVADKRWSATYVVHLERETYTIRIEKGQLTCLARTDGAAATTTLWTDQQTFSDLLTKSVTRSAAVKDGRLRFEGDAAALDRLVGITPHTRK